MKLIKGECLREMQLMNDNSINLIICDLPYGVATGDAINWDIIIEPDKLFNEYKRILKPNGSILLFGMDPFSTSLRNAAMDIYKYDMYWIKDKPSGFLNSANMPLRKVELISVFSNGVTYHAHITKNRMTYNPQGLIKLDKPKTFDGSKTMRNVYANTVEDGVQITSEYTNYPSDVLEYKHDSKRLHPTQKPVKLYEYLIRTYSNPGDIILDNCAGSGTLGAAGLNIDDREYIMIELDPSYQDVIIDRLPDIEIVEGDQEVYRSVLEWNVDGVKEMLDEGKKIYEVLEYFGKNRIELNKMLKKSKTSLNRLMG